MSLWTELRRRKVFQVGAAYLIVGWLLIQIAALVFPELQLPAWTVTFVTVLIIFCFPIAVFLAWAYELSPGGIRRTTPLGSGMSDAAPPPMLGYAITAVAAAAVGAGAYWLLDSDGDAAWLASALPEIEEHLSVADFESAYALVREVEQRFPDSPELDGLWTRVSWTVSIPSEPPGAHVYRRAFGSDGDWEDLGTTPLENIRFPFGLSEIRLELDGYRTLHRTLGGGHLQWDTLLPGIGGADALFVGPELYRLDADESLPADKVRVAGWVLPAPGRDLEIGDYFLGKYEVTNEEYKAFVDAGGYQSPNLWDPIVLNGETISLQTAMERGLFLDRTRRPGPSTWSAGDYAEGEGDMPVSGLSWYEASAYARFVGQELPTVIQWERALATSTFPWLLPVGNFSGEGPRRVTESRALSYSGAYDMVGNVREWTANSIGDEKVILGGNWNDPYYIAGTTDASAPPLDRSDGNGLRLMMTSDRPQVSEFLRAPLPSRSTAAPTEEREPVSDEIYAAYSRVFAYDHTPLNERTEAVDETRVWTRERITFDPAYGADRVVLYLYLPTTGRAPFQTVVYWCGWDTFRLDDVDHYFARQIDFIVKSGRAVAFPVLRGTFERRVGNVRQVPDFDTVAWRDNTIDALKDVRRTIDYLETRRDIDKASLAYFGYSWGGANAPIALAQEDRFKAAVIDIGLMPAMPSIPEVDPLNSLPRIDVPTLMLSGEFDPLVSRADADRYFELIGVPAAEKRHVIALGGHFIPRDLLIRETLDWLDKYLGPTGN